MAWAIGICAILRKWKRQSMYFSDASHGLTRASGSMRSRHEKAVCYESGGYWISAIGARVDRDGGECSRGRGLAARPFLLSLFTQVPRRSVLRRPPPA